MSHLVQKRFLERIRSLIQLYRRIRSKFLQLAEYFLVSPHSDHARSSQQLRNLHRKLPGNSRRAKNQHRLARRKLRAVRQRYPRGNARIRQCRGSVIFKPGGQRKAERPRRHRTLGHCSKRASRPSKEDPRAILEVSHSIRPANQRQLPRTRKMRPTSQLLIHGLQRRRPHTHDRLTFTRLRLVKLLVFRRFAKFMQYRSLHAASSHSSGARYRADQSARDSWPASLRLGARAFSHPDLGCDAAAASGGRLGDGRKPHRATGQQLCFRAADA